VTSRPTIAALFLDIGGVLLTNGWDRAMRAQAVETFGLDPAEVDERHRLTFDTYEEGKSSLDDYLTSVVFYTKRSFTREEFKAFMFAQSQPYPEMLQLIRHLKARHRLKVLAVNNEGRELNVHRVQTYGLGELMDAFVSSCFVHYRKPDLDIYRLALDIAQVPPRQVVYLDDRALFVDVARELGIHGIHHIGYESTRTALAALGLSMEN
jgi:putative hydrolase of the HAD superfamily